MYVSVIIPTYNKSTRLYLTLLTLENQTYPFDEFEVIVVDDGSSGDTFNVVKSIKDNSKLNLTYMYQKNSGRAKARNTGIKIAMGELIIFLDDDRMTCKEFISQHVQSHKNSDREKVILGKRMNIYISKFDDEFENIKDSYVEDEMKLYKKSREEYYWRKIKDSLKMESVCWILFTTGNVSLRIKSLMKSGLFNESFKGWGLEDTELGYRLWKNGIKFRADEKAINYHLEHKRDHKQRLNDEQRNHDLFYKLHPELPVKLFREFVHGEISLEKYNKTLTNNEENLSDEGKNFYQVFLKN